MRLALETIVKLGMFIVGGGQMVRVVGSFTINSCAISPGWADDVSTSGWYLLFASDGLIETSGADDDVIGTGTLALSQANVGSLCCFLGDAAEVIEITGDGTFKLAKSQTIPKTSGTFTVTIASPGVFTKAGHGFLAHQPVYLTTTGNLPTGLAASTVYYVRATGLTADDFQLSATLGGAAIDTSGSQSGTHTVHAATPFAFINAGSAHDGAGPIEAIDTGAKTITVRRRHQFRPPLNGVKAGEVAGLGTVLKQTGPGDGLKCGQAGALGLLDNIVLVGPGTGVGIAMAGRVSAGIFGDQTQRSYESNIMLGPNVVLYDWSTSAFVPRSCKLDGRVLTTEGARAIDIWNDGGDTNLRRATMVGCRGSIALQNNGRMRITELRSFAHKGDAVRREPGSLTECEMAMFGFNQGMDIRHQGVTLGVVQHVVSWACRLSSLYGLTATSEVSLSALLAARREAVEFDGPGQFTGNDNWIAGVSGSVGSGHGVTVVNGARASGKNNGIVGVKAIALNADGPNSKLDFDNAYLRRNGTRSAKASNRAIIDINSVNCDGVEIATGGRVNHPNSAGKVSNAPVGAVRVNEQDALGGGVFDGAADAFGSVGLRVNGGAKLTKLLRAQVSESVPLMAAGDRHEFNVPVAGALVNSCVARASINNLNQAGVEIVSRVIADGSVNVVIKNDPTGTNISAGSRTVNVIVEEALA